MGHVYCVSLDVLLTGSSLEKSPNKEFDLGQNFSVPYYFLVWANIRGILC